MTHFKYIISPKVILTFMVYSCQKEDNGQQSTAEGIAGNYSGEFLSSDDEVSDRNADITAVGEKQVEVHCHGEKMDTVITLDLYENMDSVMVCRTGEAFRHEYGHMKDGRHMMDMHMDQNEWTHHLEDEHNPGDRHYGGFDMHNYTFEFTFHTHEGDSTEYMMFRGQKQ